MVQRSFDLSSVFLELEQKKSFLNIKGPLGSSNIFIPENLFVKIKKNSNQSKIIFYVKDFKNSKLLNSVVSHFSNTLHSLVFGFYRQIDLVGIGFRFVDLQKSDALKIRLGFSNEIEYKFPEEVKFIIQDTTTLILYSNSLQTLSEISNDILLLKVPDKYKGKGFYLRNIK